MTPYQIEILIHHHASHAPFGRDTAPLYAPTVKAFMDDGILTTRPDGSIGTTERGKALVDMLCLTPYPEIKWVDPRDDPNRGTVYGS